jgi:hypothetical protein
MNSKNRKIHKTESRSDGASDREDEGRRIKLLPDMGIRVPFPSILPSICCYLFVFSQ